ncbi:uncharacterized protein NECHADRAFT_56381 [Fusarium vanettenii 77-13-4]|uniref:VOC domain-containing protein n=1 Tax=Fusarium vanettenii (strain ATCC MYA-4622 / CBS 123669 / FGSC 9596 / NRRL 45880 / 77-13-4) TaxID=660122 RepID=C7ZQT2_FUSV7|nr:uncharacterized protein NECHADRAFT_56381 [Fusarium vanettenii 77-13-4]EEU33624.1 hypothetical protein NECHADRAFT_56381 [Fusarium vanettenii 77-13-4]
MAATLEPSNSIVLSPTSLCHVVLRTVPDKFPAMVHFWACALGARITWKNDFLCFLTYDDEHHRIAILGRTGTAPHPPGEVSNRSGLAHIAFGYDSLSDLLVAYGQRKTAGILPVWSVNHGPTTSIYYQDPDGNELETQVDNFETPSEATDFMNSPQWAENPIGADIDPDDIWDRLRSGESEASLKMRQPVGRRTKR